MSQSGSRQMLFGGSRANGKSPLFEAYKRLHPDQVITPNTPTKLKRPARKLAGRFYIDLTP